MPEPVTAPPTGDVAGAGFVTPSFDRGALILRDGDGRLVRLSWEAADAPSTRDRRRALPAGEYALVGYRILREDEDGATWHVSVTAPSIATLEVEEGEVAAVEVERGIRIRKRMAGGSLGMTILGQGRAGLSIYKDGERIPIGYRVLDGHGQELFSGKMTYG